MSMDNPADSASELSPDQLAADEAALRRQLDELHQMGFRPCNFRDESDAPDVDEQLLLRLIRRELPEEHAALVYRLVYSFQSWHAAFSRLMREESRVESQESRAKS